jgi:hypothetical protein
MMDLRCDNGILFGRLEDDVVEVKCRSRRCGYEPGVVVLHRFSVLTGELKGTNLFKDPAHNKEVKENVASLRTS